MSNLYHPWPVWTRVIFVWIFPAPHESTNLCISFGFPALNSLCGKRVLPGLPSCCCSAQSKHLHIMTNKNKNLSMQTNYSIKQPSKCDHATQMQLEVIKICSSESKKPSKEPSCSTQGCEDASRDTQWLALTNLDWGFRDDWAEPLLHREAFSWEMEEGIWAAKKKTQLSRVKWTV